MLRGPSAVRIIVTSREALGVSGEAVYRVPSLSLADATAPVPLDTLLHSDAAQAFGKVPIDVEADGIDLMSITAHKMYGPKGVGALYVRRRKARLQPLIDGGGHERFGDGFTREIEGRSL